MLVGCQISKSTCHNTTKRLVFAFGLSWLKVVLTIATQICKFFMFPKKMTNEIYDHSLLMTKKPFSHSNFFFLKRNKSHLPHGLLLKI